MPRIHRYILPPRPKPWLTCCHRVVGEWWSGVPAQQISNTRRSPHQGSIQKNLDRRRTRAIRSKQKCPSHQCQNALDRAAATWRRNKRPERFRRSLTGFAQRNLGESATRYFPAFHCLGDLRFFEPIRCRNHPKSRAALVLPTPRAGTIRTGPAVRHSHTVGSERCVRTGQDGPRLQLNVTCHARPSERSYHVRRVRKEHFDLLTMPARDSRQSNAGTALPLFGGEWLEDSSPEPPGCDPAFSRK